MRSIGAPGILAQRIYRARGTGLDTESPGTILSSHSGSEPENGLQVVAIMAEEMLGQVKGADGEELDT